MCLPGRRRVRRLVRAARRRVHPCAINLGRRPTFYEHADHSLLEAHLLDFDGDLYGERPESASPTSCAASASSTASTPSIAQLNHDIEHARQLMA